MYHVHGIRLGVTRLYHGLPARARPVPRAWHGGVGLQQDYRMCRQRCCRPLLSAAGGSAPSEPPTWTLAAAAPAATPCIFARSPRAEGGRGDRRIGPVALPAAGASAVPVTIDGDASISIFWSCSGRSSTPRTCVRACVRVRVCACVSSLRASSPRTGSTLGSDDNASDDWNRAGTALIIRPVVMLPPIPNMSSSSTPPPQLVQSPSQSPSLAAMLPQPHAVSAAPRAPRAAVRPNRLESVQHSPPSGRR